MTKLEKYIKENIEADYIQLYYEGHNVATLYVTSYKQFKKQYGIEVREKGKEYLLYSDTISLLVDHWC